MNNQEYLIHSKYSNETIAQLIETFEHNISNWEYMISIADMPETIIGLNVLIKVHQERIQIYKKILELRVFE